MEQKWRFFAARSIARRGDSITFSDSSSTAPCFDQSCPSRGASHFAGNENPSILSVSLFLTHIPSRTLRPMWPKSLLAWGLWLISLPVQVAGAETRIEPFAATYVLKRIGMSVGEVRRQLTQQPDGTFQFSAHSRSTGIMSLFVRDVVTEQSIFRFDNQGNMQPLEYIYQRVGGKRERRVRLTFDWLKGNVVNQIDQKAWTMVIPHNAQDKLLYQLALMMDLQGGLTQFNYEIADGGHLKSYHFEIIREEEIYTSLGRLKTQVIQRRLEGRVTTLWCAPQWHYLPVRIEQNESDGDKFQLYLEHLSGINATP